MNDLIGIPETAKLLGLSRQRVWQMYKTNELQAAMTTGTSKRPRPLFFRSYIINFIKTRQAVA